jgi:hypothetical protein
MTSLADLRLPYAPPLSYLGKANLPLRVLGAVAVTFVFEFAVLEAASHRKMK